MSTDRLLPPSTATPVSPTTGTAFATQPVDESQMAPNSVGTAELIDGSVTPAKLAVTAGLQLRRTTPFAIPAATWVNIPWEIEDHAEGHVFWNSSDAFDLLDTGWHSLVVCVAAGSGALQVRILDQSAGGLIVGEGGPTSHAVTVTARQYADPREYVVQAFNTVSGNLVVEDRVPILTARIDR